MPTETASCTSGRTTTVEMHGCYRKSRESRQAQNDKFLCPDVTHDFAGFMTELIQELVKETVDLAKKKGGEG